MPVFGCRFCTVVLSAALLLASVCLSAQAFPQLTHEVTFPRSFGYVGGVRSLGDGRILVADPLGQALVAPDGNLWVERFVSAGTPPKIDVFDARGIKTGDITLRAGRRVAGFGDGVVFLVYTDDVGLQWVERYRMVGR